MKTLIVLVALSLVRSSTLPAQSAAPPARSASSEAIDKELWSVIAATVVNADIAGMARTYHPDAIVVMPAGTKPIGSQIAKWGKDMADAKIRGDKATVEFPSLGDRTTQRLRSRRDSSSTR